MNREQRRALIKKAVKKGVPSERAKKIIEIAEHGAGEHTDVQEIKTGDKVKLNVDAVKARKHYDAMLQTYRDFVEANADTVFTAVVENSRLVHMEEEPKWLFWCGDLILVERSAAEVE